jgi:phytoene desaturase
MNHEASNNSYDVVVIGGGIGGLTCGAFLSQAGKQVLVVEGQEHAGGFAREYEHGSYKINPALHVIMGCGPTGTSGHGLIDEALRQLGVQDQCEFTPVDPFYRAQFPDFQIDVPAGREGFLDTYQKTFSGEAKGIGDLFNLCSQVYQEYIRFPVMPRWRDWALMPLRFPRLFRYANATLGSVMKSYLSNPKLMAAYAVLWPYVGLPPSRISFSMWATMISSYIEEGAFYCRGGFQNIANALANGLVNHGGELILGTPVAQINASNSAVTGVSLENGQEIKSPVVISNIDAIKTFRDLLEPGQIPSSYIQKLRELEPSLSVLGLHLATDLDIHDLGVPKVTIITQWDLDSAYRDALGGRVSGLAMHIPTVYDASLAPLGEHLVILQAFIPSDAEKLSPLASAQFAKVLLEGAERVLPDLRNHITFVDGYSEGSAQQHPLHRLGPIYGWAATPQQSGPRRLPNRTPIGGLYLTGHWTQPGHGIWTVILSGIITARLVLGQDASQSLWPFAL